jgi:uncharacterized membrane protein YgdD (TMEM256/DUF423 family)
MDRIFAALGAASGFVGVAAGAFGAHTAARYQMIHALALLAVAWAISRWPGRAAVASGWCFVAGTLIFSGSLYLLALTGVRGLGAITPVGGVLFLCGWLLLALAAWRGGAR